MPSVFSHAVVGATVMACGLPRPRASLIVHVAMLAVVPDLDVVALAFGWGLDHPFGHRGLSHSLVASALFAGAAVLASRLRSDETRLRVWIALTMAAASHGLLDAMTNGGRGVAFLAPFSDVRWHFPFRPIEVSPIGVREFFTGRGVEVIANELQWLWLPSAVLLAAVWGLRRLSDPRTPSARVPGR